MQVTSHAHKQTLHRTNTRILDSVAVVAADEPARRQITKNMLSAVKLLVTNDQPSVETLAAVLMLCCRRNCIVVNLWEPVRYKLQCNSSSCCCSGHICFNKTSNGGNAGILATGHATTLPGQADHGRAWAGIAIRQVHSSEQDLVSIDMRL